jgi:hypothetical protein
MTIDDVQEMVEPTPTLQDRVAKRRLPEVITTYSQHYGNRVISHFYPEHWAQVQLARATMQRWGTDA